MTVARFPDVDRDCTPRFLKCKRGVHRLTLRGPRTGGWRRDGRHSVVRKLYPHERQRVTRRRPRATPAGDERRELRAIRLRHVVCVRLALIPDESLHRKSHNRMHHPIVQRTRHFVDLLPVFSKRELLDGEFPIARERHKRSIGATQRHCAVDATAAAAIGHAHGQYVAPRAQHRRSQRVAARTVVACRFADFGTVHPCDVIIVDGRDLQRHASARVGSGEVKRRAIPRHPVHAVVTVRFPVCGDGHRAPRNVVEVSRRPRCQIGLRCRGAR